MDYLTLIAIMLAAGAAAGFLAGLLGVGGGIVVVPAVFYGLGILDMAPDVRMQVAVGSSLATIVFTGSISARSHFKRGNVNQRVLKIWIAPILLGVVIGTYVAALMSSRMLALVFGIVALCVAAWLVFGKSPTHENTEPETGSPFFQGAGVFVGFISALMGIGGGTISVPLLTAIKERVHRAVGTSAAIGVAIGVVGMLGFIITGWNVPNLPPLSFGFVNLIAVAAVIPTSMLVAPLGAKVVTMLDAARVKQLFAGFLILVAFNMLRTALAG